MRKSAQITSYILFPFLSQWDHCNLSFPNVRPVYLVGRLPLPSFKMSICEWMGERELKRDWDGQHGSMWISNNGKANGIWTRPKPSIMIGQLQLHAHTHTRYWDSFTLLNACFHISLSNDPFLYQLSNFRYWHCHQFELTNFMSHFSVMSCQMTVFCGANHFRSKRFGRFLSCSVWLKLCNLCKYTLGSRVV